MTPRMLHAAFLLVLGLLVGVDDAMGQHARVQVPADPHTLQRLSSLGILPDHAHPGEDGLVVEWDAEELARAEAAGITLQVVVENLEEWYASRADADPGPGEGMGAPAGFHLGGMGGYLTPDEVIAEMDSLHLHYPQLVSNRVSIGQTAEGRAIWMLRLSDNPQLDEMEPEALYIGLHHAREPISVMALFYFMHHLLEGYGSDSMATYLLRERELYFIPVLNPDGYAYNHTAYPNGGGMWRKNRSPLPGGLFGVDLNRNYGHAWAYDDNGSSPNPSSNTYRGPSAFSELETQAIRNLCMDHQFSTVMSFHSYGEYLIYPWGHMATPPPGMAHITDMAGSIARSSHYYPGNSLESVGYSANGTLEDWMLGETALKPVAYTFAPECGNSQDGFWPAPSRIVPICAEMLSANLRAARLAGACVDPVDVAPAFLSGNTLHLPLKLRNAGHEAEGPFQIQFSSSHPAITGIGNPVQQAVALGAGDSMQVFFALNIDPATQPGTHINGEAILNLAGGVALSLPLSFQWGVPDTLALHGAEAGLLPWAGAWSLSPERAHTGAYAYTDSPFLDYLSGLDQTFSLPPINLTTYRKAALSFHAFWELDHAGDHVTIWASEDGISYAPLEGRQTWVSTSPSQPGGLPMYEGRRYGWVEERIDLSAFDGRPLHLRFQLHTSAWGNRDGFYFDDFAVTAFKLGSNGTQGPLQAAPHLIPNPGAGQVRIHLTEPATPGAMLEIADLQGRILRNFPAEAATADLSDLAPGLYLYRLAGPSGEASAWSKWVKH